MLKESGRYREHGMDSGTPARESRDACVGRCSGTFGWRKSAGRTGIETNQETLLAYAGSFSQHGKWRRGRRLHHDNGSWAGRSPSLVLLEPRRVIGGRQYARSEMMPCMTWAIKIDRVLPILFGSCSSGGKGKCREPEIGGRREQESF